MTSSQKPITPDQLPLDFSCYNKCVLKLTVTAVRER